jgi:hypothetical protein
MSVRQDTDSHALQSEPVSLVQQSKPGGPRLIALHVQLELHLVNQGLLGLARTRQVWVRDPIACGVERKRIVPEADLQGVIDIDRASPGRALVGYALNDDVSAPPPPEEPLRIAIVEAIGPRVLRNQRTGIMKTPDDEGNDVIQSWL